MHLRIAARCLCCAGSMPRHANVLALASRERKTDAQAALVASVTAYPCNWSAWKVSRTLPSSPSFVCTASVAYHGYSRYGSNRVQLTLFVDADLSTCGAAAL